MTEKVTLSTNQARAMAALLTEKTVRAAAAKCGLSEKTLYKYLSMDPFRRALQTEQDAIYTAAGLRLSAGIDAALDELESLVTGAKSEAVRRAAVADWLSQALKLKELSELEAQIKAHAARIEQLEAGR